MSCAYSIYKIHNEKVVQIPCIRFIQKKTNSQTEGKTRRYHTLDDTKCCTNKRPKKPLTHYMLGVLQFFLCSDQAKLVVTRVLCTIKYIQCNTRAYLPNWKLNWIITVAELDHDQNRNTLRLIIQSMWSRLNASLTLTIFNKWKFYSAKLSITRFGFSVWIFPYGGSKIENAYQDVEKSWWIIFNIWREREKERKKWDRNQNCFIFSLPLLRKYERVNLL